MKRRTLDTLTRVIQSQGLSKRLSRVCARECIRATLKSDREQATYRVGSLVFTLRKIHS